MNLEDNIKDVISKKMEDGTIEKLISEQLESGIKNALQHLLASYGDITKIIETQIKSVMVPYLENYNYSQYITKLDTVLTDVLKNAALENKVLLDNFKELMTEEKYEREIKTTDIFERWREYVAHNIETDGLEVVYDDEPCYENVDVSFHVDYEKERTWSDWQYATLVFECEHDEKMNFEIRIHCWKKFDKDKWTIDYKSVHDISSLKYLSEFEIFLMKLTQNYVKVIVDSDYETDEVEPENKPEPSYY